MTGAGRFIGALAIAGMALPPWSAARAQEAPLMLEPSSPWVVDYADESCALRREFGTPDNPVMLQVQQFVPDSGLFAVQIYGPRMRWNNTAPDQLNLRFVPDAQGVQLGGVLRITAEDLGRGVAFHTPLIWPLVAPTTDPDEAAALAAIPVSPEQQAEFAARAQQITAIEVRHAFTQDLHLATRSLAGPMQAIQQCLDELLTHWGIDVAAHRSLQRRAVPVDQRTWARAVQRAYPRTGFLQNADITVRLDVSADGTVTGCHTQQRIGDDEFEETACRQLVRHARFAPALDAAGRPVASYFIQRVMYRWGI